MMTKPDSEVKNYNCNLLNNIEVGRSKKLNKR